MPADVKHTQQSVTIINTTVTHARRARAHTPYVPQLQEPRTWPRELRASPLRLHRQGQVRERRAHSCSVLRSVP